ncbi:MAG TPA: hypothetical protein VEX43_12305 [Chthoniobacterales bacterium]|nr:hypothetical protein [Chthoniobacterales bacterium]
MMARFMAAFNKTWLRTFLDRVEGGDGLLFLYTSVIIRQFLCWIPLPNGVAWLAAALGAALVVCRYVLAKEETRERSSLAFWAVLALPLVFAYLLRFPFPDVSFDVLNYRLFQATRALRGFLDQPGDFFPTPMPFNPAPDMAMGITRLAFGYRLGTIVNLLALLWAARVLDRLLRSHLPQDWLRAGSVLVIFAAEQIFFEINTYLVDLLALPLLLEATRLALRKVEPANWSGHLARIAFLLGLSVAFKLINVVFALPIALLSAWSLIVEHREQMPWASFLRAGLLSFVTFLMPVLPFAIYLYQQTGSPVFPMMNGFFHSPYWPANNNWDDRWGAFGFWQVLAWPLKMLWQPERLSELSVYSGRLSLGAAGALLALVLAWQDKQLRRLCVLTLTGLLLWSAASGYVRYAIFLELTAGALLVMLAVDLMKRNWQLGLGLVTLCLLGTQAAVACRYVGKTEWSGRPTIFQYPAAWRRETQYVLRDHSLRRFSPKPDWTRFAQVEVWIESGIKTSGLEILLNDKAPVIGLRSHESFVSADSRRRFVHALDRATGKRMFTICFAEDLPQLLEFIKLRGLVAGAQTPLLLPFYSRDIPLPLILLEVTGVEQAATAMRQTL